MSGGRTQTIALVSQVWRGHVPAYHGHYARAFARTGARVVEIIPPEAATRAMAASLDLSPTTPSPARRLLRVVRLGLAWCGVWPALESVRLWWRTARRVRAEERRLGIDIDAVFLTYLDWAFVARGMPGWAVDILLARPWAGVRLHPLAVYGRGAGPFPGEEGVFSARHCRALVVVDDAFAPAGRACWPGRTVVTGPEIADLSPPDKHQPVAMEVKRWAAGRKVVGLLGVISAKKNVGTFIAMARLAEAAGDDMVFFLAGDLIREGAEAAAAPTGDPFPDLPANCRAWAEPLREGAEFNALVTVCDALFLAYRPAPEKSNVLTKAAHFRRPVLASEGHLMAGSVREFALGAVVPPGDAGASLEALRELFARSGDTRGYDGFLDLNSVGRLDRAVACVAEALR